MNVERSYIDTGRERKFGVVEGVLILLLAAGEVISQISGSESKNPANQAGSEGNANIPRSGETTTALGNAELSTGRFDFPDEAKGSSWNCAEVPVGSNFFRTVKIAGNPSIWESPPYLFFEKKRPTRKNMVPKYKKAEVVNDLTSKDLVHAGDVVCVDP